MALVNQVQKRIRMSKSDIVKYQILTHCFVNKITVSQSDLECLTLLATLGPIELTSFCYDASEEYNIFKSSQTVRNCVNKFEKQNIIIKDTTNKKVILLNENLKIQTDGNILLDYKFLANES
jgi:hypothetical protein